jgi:hypothetical protein
MAVEQRSRTRAHVSVTRTTDRWTIDCSGVLDQAGADELDRVVRVGLAERPLSLRLDLSGLCDVCDDGIVTLGDVIRLCKERAVRVMMFLSLETPVQLLVDLDDQIREVVSTSDDVGLGGQGPASVSFERGGILVSV